MPACSQCNGSTVETRWKQQQQGSVWNSWKPWKPWKLVQAIDPFEVRKSADGAHRRVDVAPGQWGLEHLDASFRPIFALRARDSSDEQSDLGNSAAPSSPFGRCVTGFGGSSRIPSWHGKAPTAWRAFQWRRMVCALAGAKVVCQLLPPPCFGGRRHPVSVLPQCWCTVTTG